MAIAASAGKLKLYGSPWSAPGWMKTDGEMTHGGNLKGPVNGQYYQTWANYFISKGLLTLRTCSNSRYLLEDYC
uniref:Glucosylceramidase n=1 Tax=Acrobeloides nanus TaxID=290746 RepID=A0A914CG72_9BILA